MSLVINPAYNQLSESMGPYYAALEIADIAKGITSSLDNRITMSSALDFAARGVLPNPKDYPDHRLDRVKEYLTYINDKDIKTAVIDSYEESLKKYHLVFVYNNIDDEPRKSRVRIILRILWDNRPHKKD